MSGPALEHVHSHSAIHDAALNEAIELTELLDHLVRDDELEKALEVAFVLIEQWETRTLRHASEEEKGLYKDLVEESPELKDDIIRLTRDHDLLRLLAKEIRHILSDEGINDQVIQRFQSLVLVDLLHNQKEEQILPHD